MNDNLGEQVACGSNLGSSQCFVNKLYGHKENLAGVDELSVCL